MSDVTLTKGGGWLTSPVGEAVVFTPEMYTPEQKEMYNTAIKFGREEVSPKLGEIELADDKGKRDMNAELLRKAGEIGLLMIDIPEEYDGLGSDKTTSFLIAEAVTLPVELQNQVCVVDRGILERSLGRFLRDVFTLGPRSAWCLDTFRIGRVRVELTSELSSGREEPVALLENVLREHLRAVNEHGMSQNQVIRAIGR